MCDEFHTTCGEQRGEVPASCGVVYLLLGEVAEIKVGGVENTWGRESVRGRPLELGRLDRVVRRPAAEDVRLVVVEAVDRHGATHHAGAVPHLVDHRREGRAGEAGCDGTNIMAGRRTPPRAPPRLLTAYKITHHGLIR